MSNLNSYPDYIAQLISALHCTTRVPITFSLLHPAGWDRKRHETRVRQGAPKRLLPGGLCATPTLVLSRSDEVCKTVEHPRLPQFTGTQHKHATAQSVSEPAAPSGPASKKEASGSANEVKLERFASLSVFG